MDNIVTFPKPEEPEYCFVCGCGSQDFRLMFGGTVECVGCDAIATTMVWIHLPPETRKDSKR